MNEIEERIVLKTNNTVNIDGIDHPIIWGSPLAMSDEYSFVPFAFSDENLTKTSDGGFFALRPYGKTRTVKITGEVSCADNAIHGDGWFLGISPEGDLVTIALNSESFANTLLKYGKGWTICYIAGPRGLAIANINTPPFQDDMEEALHEYQKFPEDTDVINDYWDYYEALTNQHKY